jgi:DNA-binding Lrp family transcriptional regulator
MENPPVKSSNFYMLTAQVLNDKKLNHAEKITMAILYGLADEDGKCWPSNEWLAEKLDLKENAIRVILTNLEKNNYIRRELVSWANNPFKKYRNIYVSNNFKLSLPVLENEGVGILENEQPDPSKTRDIIDKKDTIYKKESSSPSPLAQELASHLLRSIKKSKPDLKDPNLKSWTLEIDRMLRIDKRSPESIKRILDWLPTSSFWSTNILSASKLREKFDQLELKMRQDPSKTSSDDLQLIQKLSEKPRLLEQYKIVLGADYVDFPTLRDSYFKVGEPAFRDKVLNSMRKLGIKIKE